MLPIPSTRTDVITRDGRPITILSLTDLRDPLDTGERLRAFCHLHGGDNQRSLSIQKTSGWGRCFNAHCQRTVLVKELNPTIADRLLAKQARRSHRAPVPLSAPHVSSQPTPSWQQDEIAALLALDALLRQGLTDFTLGDCWQALAYLEARGIPVELAQATGVGYLSHEACQARIDQRQYAVLQRWTDRLLFPLRSPTGNGYIGRSLWRWQLGMNEQTHKAVLEQEEAPRRWIKTNPAGWFCARPVDFASCVVLVEGSFDRLALLAAGFAEHEVVALVGTAVDPGWFPKQVKGVVLALDADDGGREAMLRLAEQFLHAGISTLLCPPPADQWGKDWNERWQKLQADGIEPVCETLMRLGHLVEQ